jgi:hypothetical protein
MWQDEDFGTLPIEAQTLFVGLITQADDQGRLEGSATRMRALIWPYRTELDTARVESWLDELHSAGLIERYEVDDKQYLALPNWHRHQKVQHASQSQLPAPDGPDSRVLMKSHEDSRGLAPDQGSRIKDQGSIGANAPVEPGGLNGSGVKAVQDLFTYWQQRCGHEQAKLTDERRRKIQARLRQGYTVDQIRAAIDGAAEHAFVNEEGKRFDDLELICRNGSKLEDFIGRGSKKGHSADDGFAARLNARSTS